MRLGVIYKVNIGKNFIVGSTINWHNRKNKYTSQLKNNKHKNQYLQNSYNKYGASLLKFDILQENVPENLLLFVEDIWIGALCGRIEDKSFGMNMRDASTVNHSKETILKLSKPIIQRDKKGNFIKRWDSTNDVYRANPLFKGKNIPTVLKGKRKTAFGFQWYYENQDSSKSVSPNKQCFKVNQKDLQGNFIKVWESTAEPTKEGFKQPQVWACCKGSRKSHGGFKWEFA